MRFTHVLALLAAIGSAQAGEPTSFPGADRFPLHDLGSDNNLMGDLYDGKSLSGPAFPLCQPDCLLTVKGRLSWLDRFSRHHVGLVIAAEPSDPSHADGAYIGMADLLETDKGWTINAGSPKVAEEGGFGKAPNIQVISAGYFGMIVVTTPGYTGQGETDQNWHLYVQSGDQFIRKLSVPILHDSSGMCDDDTCRLHDFTATAQVSDEHFGLYVRVTTKPFKGTPTFRDYTIVP
jgi:hypothetical protein